jgi:hypothetical protein
MSEVTIMHVEQDVAPDSTAARVALWRALHFEIDPPPHVLGLVDGFDQDEGASESDECAITVLGLVAAHSNSLEALQLADGLLDPGAGLVEQPWEEAGPVLGVVTVRNDRDNATTAARSTVGR